MNNMLHPPLHYITPPQETYLAKHMQKHADRTDKRPPIIAGPSMGQDLWPKMDPSLYQGYADRLDPYGQGLMDHRWVETRAVNVPSRSFTITSYKLYLHLRVEIITNSIYLITVSDVIW